MTDPHVSYLLRLGDDSLVAGQRLSEWSGRAPTVEVDLSFANLALDYIGQANLLLDRAGELEGAGRDADALAFRRDVLDFQNCLLVEQPNGDFAQTVARLFLFSNWQKLLFERLTLSKDDVLAAIAQKAVKEIAYHVELATGWVVRLGDGTEESNRRMQAGLEWHWRFVDELFAQDDVDAAVIASGFGADVTQCRADYDSRVDSALAQAGLTRPAPQRPVLGGRKGHHSEHLGHMLSEMQFLPRAYPDAKW